MMKRLILMCCTVALAACATNDNSRFAEAAIAPLSDLNLVRAEIPPKLLEAQRHPYLVPEELTCEFLTQEINELDAVLGPDLDTPPSDSNPGLVERGTDEAVGAAVSALRRTTESLIPYRGWLRKLTGAERHSRKIAAAVAAGTVRRAFIKGLRASKQCPDRPSETYISFRATVQSRTAGRV